MRTKKTEVQQFTKKDNRKAEPISNDARYTTNFSSPGSVPKHYRSVISKATPVTIFGVKTDENRARSHSPGNHIESQVSQRPLKPVREFLTTQTLVNENSDDRQHSSSRTNGFARSHTEATIQNVNMALAQTANKLRPDPLNSPMPGTRSLTTLNELFTARSTTTRPVVYQNTGTTTSTNCYFQGSNETKKPLPPDLTSRRPTNFFAVASASQHRVTTGTGPLIVTRSTAATINDYVNARTSTPLRAFSTNLEVDVQPSSSDNAMLNNNSKKTKTSKTETNQQKVKSRKLSPASHSSPSDKHQRALPEVSVHPQFQSSAQENRHQLSHPTSSIATVETYANSRQTQIESHNDMRRTSTSRKSPQVIDVQPNVTMEQQPSHSPPPTPCRSVRTKDSTKPVHPNEQGLTHGRTHTHLNDNDSVSAMNQENTSNRLFLSRRNENPLRASSETLIDRKNVRGDRPTSRLNLYDDESESEITVTEIPSKDYGVGHHNDQAASDLVSDVWSDLTSEFSATKLRKHSHVRTSTPNLTRRSSSYSSKEIRQLRKQLNSLQIMYEDLFRVLDNDAETVKDNVKTNAASTVQHNERKHRFRKMFTMRQPSIDMKEINQRFTRLESSIVTLAESIAKLSAQVQLQRGVKDEVADLRAEVAELRQQISHQPTRLLSASVQHLAAINTTSSINMFTPSSPRPTTIIDPRHARKIEQFFGTEVLLHYFLTLLNYQEYISIFERENIGFCELAFVDERKLQSFGIPHGPSVRIVYEAQRYFISLLAFKSNRINV
ncbi:unnamed protein product [Adineta ricciae]|uniref:SAM domain-containing protein n=1 Tax=Adineta ricciae TaxID=249248 RepID=A0A815RIS7_ADIRI|nr:unnamed protein product [Adineta ricciae]